MKDIMLMLGFGFGLVTGALLYKYSECAKQAVDKSEKAVVQEVEKLEQKAKKLNKEG